MLPDSASPFGIANSTRPTLMSLRNLHLPSRGCIIVTALSGWPTSPTSTSHTTAKVWHWRSITLAARPLP